MRVFDIGGTLFFFLSFFVMSEEQPTLESIMLLLQEVQKENKELKKKISNRQIKEEEEDYNENTRLLTVPAPTTEVYRLMIYLEHGHDVSQVKINFSVRMLKNWPKEFYEISSNKKRCLYLANCCSKEDANNLLKMIKDQIKLVIPAKKFITLSGGRGMMLNSKLVPKIKEIAKEVQEQIDKF